MRDNPDIRQLNLRDDGLFSNVNEVVEQLRRAERDGYRFIIDWNKSCYKDENSLADPWEYFFYPCFDVPNKKSLSRIPSLVGGPPVACSIDNVITPRLREGVCNPLLLPKDRHEAFRIIKKYIRLKESVSEKIDAFFVEHFRQPVIGLHVRGAGRTDGGVPEMRRILGGANDVPMVPFFNAVDGIMEGRKDARIFACSDSLSVMRAIIDRYGSRVIFWPALRSEFGEMHANHPANAGQHFPGFQLGSDVIAEAWLLARTSWLVHGNSNVTNFVLCLNPNLGNSYIAA